jgi:hypothetical protein
VSRPLIQVQTCFSEEDCGSPSLEEAIARAEHRDACFARLEWVEARDSFDPFPALPVPYRDLDHDERILAVDGEEQAVTVVSHGDYAALRFRQGPVHVTAVARLGFSPDLSFRVIDDLEPYFAGYRRFVLGFLRLLSRLPQGVTCSSSGKQEACRTTVSAWPPSAHISHSVSPRRKAVWPEQATRTAGTRAQTTPAAVAVRHGYRGSQAT